MKKEYNVVQFNSADELFDYSYLCYSDEIWESYAKEEVKDIIEEYRLTESVGPFFVILVDGHFDIDEFTICRDYETACRLKKQLVSNYWSLSVRGNSLSRIAHKANERGYMVVFPPRNIVMPPNPKMAHGSIIAFW